MITYQNYHNHKWYTNVRIPDSVTSPREYAERAKELGHTVLSSVEHGFQGRYFEVVDLAKEYGLKPLIGAEAYWVKDRREKDGTNCHICLLAMNENGRLALNDVLAEANITGFYRQPRVDIPLIMSLPKDDVIVTSACVAGWKYEDADNIWLDFYNHFGKNFFLEVQYHNTTSQRGLNKRILGLHDRYKIPIIMGCDSHYIRPEDGQTRDDYIASSNISYAEDESGWFLDYPDGDTAYRRFAEQCVLSHSQIMDAMQNTQVFAEVQEYDSPIFNTDTKMCTIYPDKTMQERNKIYERLVWSGWDAYKHEVPEEKRPMYEEEIRGEIAEVEKCGMADYFILDNAIVKKGKENGGWLTKSGRGSAVSFITNMLLGFTEVDRLSAKVHMYPERFMTSTRILDSHSLPDIDLNVAPVEPFARAQKEVLGEDHAYPMIAYNTAKASAAWKLYARAQKVPPDEANTISGYIRKYELAVKHAPEGAADDIRIEDYIPKEYLDTYEKSKRYLKIISSWSIAPCSYLLYQGSIRREIGLVRAKDNLCCLMDGHIAEEKHFLKNDLLKVSVVESIYKMYQTVLHRDPPTVNELLAMCPPDDPAWDIYAKGCCLGINQVEKEGTAARVAKYKPKNISELAAFVAAIRPGGASFYKEFESRQPFSYGVKAFDNLMQTEEFPYSFPLYQEQIMRALNYAGIDMSECYAAIKNIAKKRVEKVLAYKEKFIDGFTEAIMRDEGRPREEADAVANKLWEVVENASGYSFNSSHSYCVALDSLYSAWIKAHYPADFYVEYIKIQENKGDKDNILAAKIEAESFFGIRFAPMRYGQDNSQIHKSATDDKLLINSLGSVKGMGKNVGSTVYRCARRQSAYFVDALSVLDEAGIKQGTYLPLIHIDYFQRFGTQPFLEKVAALWESCKHGDMKTLKKEGLSPEEYEAAARYANGQKKDGKDSLVFTFPNKDTVRYFMIDCEKAYRDLNIEDITIKERVRRAVEILGSPDVQTNLPDDRRKLIVLNVTPCKSKKDGKVWCWRIGVKSLGSGKSSRLTIRDSTYQRKPVQPGDILYATGLSKNEQGYWYLYEYECL